MQISPDTVPLRTMKAKARLGKNREERFYQVLGL